MKTFEYFNFLVDTSGDTWTIDYEDKTYNHSGLTKIMNKVGSEGWELVSVVSLVGSNKPAFVEVSLTYTTSMIYYFKREITDSKKGTHRQRRKDSRGKREN